MKARKVLALVLAFAMCLGMIPGFASADDLVADGTIVAGWLDKVAITGAMGTAGAAVGSPTQLKGYVTAPTTLVLLVKGNTAALEYGVGASALSGTFTKTGDLTQGALTGYYDGKASVAVDGVDYYVYYKTNFALGAGNSHIHIKSGEAAYYDVDLSTSGRMSTTKGNNVVEVKGADVFGQDFTYYYENLVGGKGFSYSELPVVEDKVTVTLSGDVSYAAGESAGNSDPKTFTPTQNTDLNLGGHEIVAKDVFSKDYGCGVYMSENVALNISDGTIRAPWPALNIKAGTVDVSNVTITNVQSNGQTYTDIRIPAKDVYGGVVQVSQKGDTPVSLTMDKDCKIIADTSTALLVSKSDGSSTASATLTGTTITHTHASGNVIGKGKYLSAICVGTDRSYSAGSVTWGEALKDVSVTLDGVSVTSDLVALEVNSNEVTVKGGSLTSSAGSAVSLMGGKLTIEDSETAAQAGTAIQANGYFEKTVAYVSGFPYNDGSAIYVGSNYNQTISEDEGTKNTIPYAELDISGTPTISSKNGYALRVGGDVAGGANNGAKITIAGVSSGGKVTGGPTFSSTTSGGFYTANNVKDETVAKNAIYIDKAALWTESGSLDITGGYYDTDPSKLFSTNEETPFVASDYLTKGYGAYEYSATPSGSTGKQGYFLVAEGRKTAGLESLSVNGVTVDVSKATGTGTGNEAKNAISLGTGKVTVVGDESLSILTVAKDNATVSAAAAWGADLSAALTTINNEFTAMDQTKTAGSPNTLSVVGEKNEETAPNLYLVLKVQSEQGDTIYYYMTMVDYLSKDAHLKTVLGVSDTAATVGSNITVGGKTYKFVAAGGITGGGTEFAGDTDSDGEVAYTFELSSGEDVTVTAADFVANDTGATVALYTSSRFEKTTESVTLPLGKATPVYVMVTSADKAVVVKYTVNVKVCSNQISLNKLTVDGVEVALKPASTDPTLPTALTLELTQADILSMGTKTTLYLDATTFNTGDGKATANNPDVVYFCANATNPKTTSAWNTLWTGTVIQAGNLNNFANGKLAVARELSSYFKLESSKYVLNTEGTVVYVAVRAADGISVGYYKLTVTVKDSSSSAALSSLKLNGVDVSSALENMTSGTFTLSSDNTTQGCQIIIVPAATVIPYASSDKLTVEAATDFAGKFAAEKESTSRTVASFTDKVAGTDTTLYEDTNEARVWTVDVASYGYVTNNKAVYLAVTPEAGGTTAYYRVEFTCGTLADASSDASVTAMAITPTAETSYDATTNDGKTLDVVKAQSGWSGEGSIANPYRASVTVKYADRLYGSVPTEAAYLKAALTTNDAKSVKYVLAPYSTTSVSNYTTPNWVLNKDGDSFTGIIDVDHDGGAADASDNYLTANLTTVDKVQYAQSIFMEVTAQNGTAQKWYRVDVIVENADSDAALSSLAYTLSYTDAKSVEQTMSKVNVPLVTDKTSNDYGKIDAEAVKALGSNYAVSTDGMTLYVTLPNGSYTSPVALVEAAAASTTAKVVIDSDGNTTSSDSAKVGVGVGSAFGSANAVTVVTAQATGTLKTYTIAFKKGAASNDTSATIDYEISKIHFTGEQQKIEKTAASNNTETVTIQLASNPALTAGTPIKLTLGKASEVAKLNKTTLDVTLMDSTSGSAYTTVRNAITGDEDGALVGKGEFTVTAENNYKTDYTVYFYMNTSTSTNTSLAATGAWSYKAGTDAAVAYNWTSINNETTAVSNSTSKMTPNGGTVSAPTKTNGLIKNTVMLYNNSNTATATKALLASPEGNMTVTVALADAYATISSVTLNGAAGTVPAKAEGKYTFTLPLSYGNGTMTYVVLAEDQKTSTTYTIEFCSSTYVDTVGPTGAAIDGSALTKAIQVAKTENASSPVLTIIPKNDGKTDNIAQVKLDKTLVATRASDYSLKTGSNDIALDIVADFGTIKVPYAALSDLVNVASSNVTIAVENLKEIESDLVNDAAFNSNDFVHGAILSVKKDNGTALTTANVTTIDGGIKGSGHEVLVSYKDTSYKSADVGNYAVDYKSQAASPATGYVLAVDTTNKGDKDLSVNGVATIKVKAVDTSLYLLKAATTYDVTFDASTAPNGGNSWVNGNYVTIKDSKNFEIKELTKDVKVKSAVGQLSFTITEKQPETYAVKSVKYGATTATVTTDVPVDANGVYTVPVTGDIFVYITLTASNKVTDATTDTNGSLLVNGKSAAEGLDVAQGSTVALTLDPATAGYEIDTLTVSYGTTTLEKADLGYDEKTDTYSFVMPAFPVTVTATFEKLSVTVADGSATKGTANELKGTVSGTTLTVSGTAPVVAVDQTGKALAKGTAANTFTLTGDETAVTLVRLGDVDLNGKVEANDALYAAENAVGSRTLTGAALAAANVDGTAGVSGNDALYIAEAAVGNRTLAW